MQDCLRDGAPRELKDIIGQCGNRTIAEYRIIDPVRRMRESSVRAFDLFRWQPQTR
jgi:hypothetical protein